MTLLSLHDATWPKRCLLLFVQQTHTVTTCKVSDDSSGLWQFRSVSLRSCDWLQDMQHRTIGVKVPYRAEEKLSMQCVVMWQGWSFCSLRRHTAKEAPQAWIINTLLWQPLKHSTEKTCHFSYLNRAIFKEWKTTSNLCLCSFYRAAWRVAYSKYIVTGFLLVPKNLDHLVHERFGTDKLRSFKRPLQSRDSLEVTITTDRPADPCTIQ